MAYKARYMIKQKRLYNMCLQIERSLGKKFSRVKSLNALRACLGPKYKGFLGKGKFKWVVKVVANSRAFALKIASKALAKIEDQDVLEHLKLSAYEQHRYLAKQYWIHKKIKHFELQKYLKPATNAQVAESRLAVWAWKRGVCDVKGIKGCERKISRNCGVDPVSGIVKIHDPRLIKKFRV